MKSEEKTQTGSRKSLNENMEFLIKNLEEVRSETEKDQKENCYVWSEHYSNWIEILGYFIRNRNEDFTNSCVGFRLVQLNKELLWLWFESTSGVYDNTIRELRFVLESFLQAYYVDTEHPDAVMECKLEVIKEIDKLVGSKLIDKINIKGRYKQNIKILYSDLSKYTHPSKVDWNNIINEGGIDTRVIFIYDRKSFNKCIEFTDRIIDAVVFLLMNYLPEFVDVIRNDKYVLKSLKNIEDSLVKQYLEETG